MEQLAPPPPTLDPDFRPQLSERSLPIVVHPGAYRRILANPFLGFLGIGFWLAAIRLVVLSRSDPLGLFLAFVVLPALAVIVLPRLFRYHCLDCGRSGRLGRWTQHVCPAVAARIVEKRPRRFRGPRPLVQTCFWAVLLVVVLLLANAAGLTSR
ncbi:hypothetical protein [Tautonia marina]|uniref:hypothetical protein n=1 Tax=Tautonia marina TaxID=2653855 RepID=UPI001260A219|nr:hypothetical protein [Tautonia marina]